jgi:hypothetical protein
LRRRIHVSHTTATEWLDIAVTRQAELGDCQARQWHKNEPG